MSTICTACNGTGMLPGSKYLDCASCETATQRVMLETWAKEQGMRIDPDQLWAVFRKGQEGVTRSDPKALPTKSKDELIDALVGAGFPTMQMADDFQRKGLAKYTGNQWNPNWDWDREALARLSNDDVARLYGMVKK